MTIAIRANDLRTESGRSTGERKALKALRRAYIEANPQLSAEALYEEMLARGWISKTTYKQDVIRSIKHHRDHDRQTHQA